MNAIEIRGLKKEFREFSLGPLDLDIPQGSIVGFIGENGAGKTTTIKLLFDIIKRDEGIIRVLGEEVLQISSSTKEEVGVVLDNSEFQETLRIKDVNCIMKRMFKNWDEVCFLKWKKEFRLPEKTLIKDYSKGMKMKLSLAVALSHDPRLLVLDEPTSGLDPVVREEMLEVFQEFVQNEDHTIFVSSHILSDLEKICDYIAFIHQGKLVFMENREDLNDKYGIIQCSKEQLGDLPHHAVVGVREHGFGAEVLVYRHQLGKEWEIERANIEQIMVFYSKGVRG